MRLLYVLGIIMLCSFNSSAQFTFSANITGEEGKSLPGASAVIRKLNKAAVADSSGLIRINNIPAGTFEILFSFVGYQEQVLTFSFPDSSDVLHRVELSPEDEEEEEVIINATRVSRSIAGIPTRIETISGEELQEKGNMKPGDIRMMLNESTGIQTQQTSATSYNSSIRIQGLDGRYTQLLRDGLPLYSGFSGGLSLMQIAPLDLQQVEVIKGSSSTLYGAGAIAGLVNLVSKKPGEQKELNFLINGTSALGLDMSGFYSERFGKTGLTVFGSGNLARSYDPADIGFSAIPEYKRYTINPRFFVYGEKTDIILGLSYITESRLGGSMEYIKNGGSGYFEKNNTDRITGQAEMKHRINEQSGLVFKGSYTRFNRSIAIPAYTFAAVQQAAFSEINYHLRTGNSQWIIGANLLTDGLNETSQGTVPLRDYQTNTVGIFIQQSWTPAGPVSVETGLRGDFVNKYGFSLLPRIAIMYKAHPELTIRLGGGLGYKTPSLFNEEAEKRHFRDIQPIDPVLTANERSAGGNLDFNYQHRFGKLGFTLNHLFYYTRLNRPLVLTPSAGAYAFVNANGFMDSKGIETNLRLTYQSFKLFIGYTYANVNSRYNSTKEWFPLTARHRLNNVLMFEQEEKWKVGLEAYYTSPQRLSDNSMGRSYWVCGVMAERLWEKFSVFVNFENLLDTRQSRFDFIYTGTVNNPVFRDIYAPVDGFVVNGGIKLKLF